MSDRTGRAKARRFVAEGPQAVGEALRWSERAAGGAVVEVYATAAAGERHADLHDLAHSRQVPWHLVDADVLDTVASTVHPQGVVAVCPFLDVSVDVALRLDLGPDAAPRLVAVGVDVRDPGNAGTLLRCADAAGADAVVLAGEGVDPYNPKAVRASAGSLFHLPLAVARDPREVLRILVAAGLQVLAADGAAPLDLDGAEDAGMLTRPTAWLFGNEAHGLPGPVVEATDAVVAVPLHGRAESLNLAAAAAVCLYASARAQRRAQHLKGR